MAQNRWGGGMILNFLSFFPGVPLFFMVSGFLITDSYLNSKSLKKYAIKRILRIYPALFLNILILEFAMYIGGNMANMSISLLEYIVYFFVYIVTASSSLAHFIIGAPSGVQDIYNYTAFFSTYPSGVLWTLSVELSFYFLLPILLMLKNEKLRNMVLFAFIFLSLAISSYATKDFYTSSNIAKLLYIVVLPYFWIFAIGIFIRLYWQNIQKYFIGYGVFYLIFYLIFCLFAYKFGHIYTTYRNDLNILTVLQTIFLSFAMFSMAFSYTKMKLNRNLDLSYSFYLYHMLIVQILISFGSIGIWYLYFVVIGFTLCIAYISWIFIEKPMLKLKGKI